MKIEIRKMLNSDIIEFPKEFEKQGWNKPVEQFQIYYNDQEMEGEKCLWLKLLEM